MSYLLNHITQQAQRSFDEKSGADPIEHWFNYAQKFHDECVANGLTGTASQVKRLIEHQRKLVVDRGQKV